MRCDHPMGCDEDYLDTPCEMFVQFMFQNAELSDSSDSDDHLPIVHSPSASPSSGESSGDEAESVCSLTDLLNYAEDVTSGMLGDVQSVSTMIGDMENISNTLGDGQGTSSTLGDGQSASNTLGDGKVISNTLDGAEDFSNMSDDVEGTSQNSVNDLSISEEPFRLENDPLEVYQLVDECTDDLSENDNMCNPENEDDSVDIYEIVDESTEDFSDGHQSVTSENSENCNISNVVSEETNDCKCVPSNEVFFKELPMQIDTSPNDYNAPSLGTCTSLSVVVPPTSFSNELKNVSEVSSDGFLSDVAPIDPPSSSLCLSDNVSIPTEDESLFTVNKICDNCEELVPDSSAVCSNFSVSENDEHRNMSELDSALGMQNSVSSVSKSENTIDSHENSLPEFDTCDVGLSAEVNVHLEENASVHLEECCDAAPDKSMPNLKRKAVESVDDNIIKKVPKFTLVHDSDEFSAVAVENYSDESSGDAEMSCFTPSAGDAERSFLAPFIDDTENVILPLEKYDEETSVTE